MAGPPVAPHIQAQTTIAKVLAIGLVLLVLGCVIAGVAWPNEVKQTGNRGALTFGLILAGLGNVMALTGVVGIGVRLGVEAAAPRDS